jgi:hypothetical protein
VSAQHTPAQWRVYFSEATGKYHVKRGDELLTSANGWPRSFSSMAVARDAAKKANAKATGSAA